MSAITLSVYAVFSMPLQRGVRTRAWRLASAGKAKARRLYYREAPLELRFAMLVSL